MEQGSLTEQQRMMLEYALVLRGKDLLYQRDFHAWLHDQVVTQDEATQQWRRWPTSQDQPYLDEAANVLMTRTAIAIPKSRRMMITWLLSSYLVWKARYNPAGLHVIQADTESKSALFLNDRCVFVEDHLLDAPIRRKYQAHRGNKDGLISRVRYYQTGSRIWAAAHGDAKVRGMTITTLLMDEIDFQEGSDQAFVAALPLREKGAQVIIASTSAGPVGPLARLCIANGFRRWY